MERQRYFDKPVKGKFLGMEYRICVHELFGHRNAYVKIPDWHVYHPLPAKFRFINLERMTGEMKNWSRKRNGEKPLPLPKGKRRRVYAGYDQMDIGVHGGLTFSRQICETDGWTQEFSPGMWIGWDYGHVHDYSPGMHETLKEISDKHPDMKEDIHTLDNITFTIHNKRHGFVLTEHHWQESEVFDHIRFVIYQLYWEHIWENLAQTLPVQTLGKLTRSSHTFIAKHVLRLDEVTRSLSDSPIKDTFKYGVINAILKLHSFIDETRRLSRGG